MKRMTPSSPPASSHRKRVLSEEERTLWEGVARQTKPLRNKSRPARMHGVEPSSSAPSVKPVVSSRPVVAAHAPKPAQSHAPPLAPLGRRQRSKLSRGKSEIDARLDLHGMTQVHAHRALLGFLQRAHHEGQTFVLVITGKGTMSGGEFERGVLRRQVPHWLSLPEFRTLVIGFEEAHIGHGGSGALYVRIRRSRS
ncbi:Smr/MutS family protein [Bradyrhizobium sp.]|jgi:DNA-nicking Smr family endonuclease|uniref:Smr/MutS family protein n=1 Tax=Bradyrhizobium sp. TaxID=376 RepID=UPI002B6568DF|nr:Smr/MutS family protein [Bradyrhizobium sp.]HWX57734.1 Smr/MutS family protein [Bradyrhizobium sp.]